MLELVAIKQKFDQNSEFANQPEVLTATVDFYQRIGYHVPWIGYFVKQDGKVVGSAGFKGRPVNGKVEIAYGTLPEVRHLGIGTEICRQLVALAITTDPTVRITARTLDDRNFSSKILRKNNFVLLGRVLDEDDGEVCEWEYQLLG
jgi:ribosomal-protein-alanine N-acetyltransferase